MTENTAKTDTGKTIHRKLISRPLFQSEKRHRRERVPAVSSEITPKNCHCRRGLDGKDGKWVKILREILNVKLRIFRNKKPTKTDSDDDDDDNEEEEDIPEKTERVYDKSERDCRYQPIRTDPDNDSLKLHTDGTIPQGENSESNTRRSNRNINKLDRYGSVPYKGNSFTFTKTLLSQNQFGAATNAPYNRCWNGYRSQRISSQATEIPEKIPKRDEEFCTDQHQYRIRHLTSTELFKTCLMLDVISFEEYIRSSFLSLNRIPSS